MTARTIYQLWAGYVGWALFAAGCLVLLVAALVWLTGCGPALEQQSMVSAYGADQLECVYLAGARDEADACRNAVRTYWCGPNGPLREAGACVYTPAADGGMHP